MHIYLIRHGETNYNLQRKLQGQIDIPLNEKGLRLAKLTGEKLEGLFFSVVYSSPLQRAIQTARLVTRDDEIPLITDDRLIELSFGVWEGKSIKKGEEEIPMDEFRVFQKDAFHFIPPRGGETIGQVCDRTADFLSELMQNEKLAAANILIASHGCAIRAMLNPYYEDPTDFWQDRVPPNCSINVLEVKDGKISIIEKDRIYYDPTESENYSLDK